MMPVWEIRLDLRDWDNVYVGVGLRGHGIFVLLMLLVIVEVAVEFRSYCNRIGPRETE